MCCMNVIFPGECLKLPNFRKTCSEFIEMARFEFCLLRRWISHIQIYSRPAHTHRFVLLVQWKYILEARLFHSRCWENSKDKRNLIFKQDEVKQTLWTIKRFFFSESRTHTFEMSFRKMGQDLKRIILRPKWLIINFISLDLWKTSAWA